MIGSLVWTPGRLSSHPGEPTVDFYGLDLHLARLDGSVMRPWRKPDKNPDPSCGMEKKQLWVVPLTKLADGKLLLPAVPPPPSSQLAQSLRQVRQAARLKCIIFLSYDDTVA